MWLLGARGERLRSIEADTDLNWRRVPLPYSHLSGIPSFNFWCCRRCMVAFQLWLMLTSRNWKTWTTFSSICFLPLTPFFPSKAGDQIEGLVKVKQALYHWTVSPDFRFLVSFLWCMFEAPGTPRRSCSSLSTMWVQVITLKWSGKVARPLLAQPVVSDIGSYSAAGAGLQLAL